MLPSALQAESADRWSTELAAFSQRDLLEKSPQGSVVFVGSSSIRLWTTLAADFPAWRCVNRGFGGSQLADSVAHFETLILPHRPRTVVIYAGENDLAEGRSPEQVARDFEALFEKIHAALPLTRVIYLAIKTSPARVHLHPLIARTNALIAERCLGQTSCTFIDTSTPLLDPLQRPRPNLFREDQLHLSPEGYRLWTDLVTRALKPAPQVIAAAQERS